MTDKVYDVYADSVYKTISVVPTGTEAPANMTIIGNYTHPDTLNANELGPDINHVMFHRIRDLVYNKIGMDIVATEITFTDTGVVIINVTSVAVTPTPSSVFVGKTVNLKATVAPTNATDQTITWKSSDTTIATVDSSGVVTGVAAGSATISATSTNNITGDADVTVSVLVNVTGVSLDSTSETLVKGATKTLTATVTPTDATDRKITWSSSNTALATVAADPSNVFQGIVTGVAGSTTETAVITVTTEDGNHTATANFTISDS